MAREHDLEDWRRAMRHVEYRAWAQEALGDQRQVYARATDRSPGAPLVFMADGEAEDLRPPARAGELACPVPGCPSPLLTTVAATDRRHHFRHRHAPADPQHNITYARVAARSLLVEWVRRQHPQYEVREEVELAGVPVSILVTSPTGRRVAICVVYERLGRDAWWDRHRLLCDEDVPAAWVFGLRPMFFQPPQMAKIAAPDAAVARDRSRGDVILDRPLFREMRAEHCWPLLISIESQQLANLIPPGGRVADRLGLEPPACREGVQHLVVHDLSGCSLRRHGIATPSVGDELLALAHRPPPRRPAPEDGPRSLAQPPSPVLPPRAEPSQPSDHGIWARPATSARAPERPAAAPPGSDVDSREARWHGVRGMLRRHLNDDELADLLERPMPTDVACGRAAPHWHLIAALAWKEKPSARTAQGLHAELTRHDWGGGLTLAAVEGIAETLRARPPRHTYGTRPR